MNAFASRPWKNTLTQPSSSTAPSSITPHRHQQQHKHNHLLLQGVLMLQQVCLTFIFKDMTYIQYLEDEVTDFVCLSM